jgi:hypothetical protein
VVWHIKAHQELIRSLQYIPGEHLLITTSSDKKVKVWNSSTGEYLVSLQQNYTKAEPTPLAYYNTKTSTLHSSDLKLSKQIEGIDPVRVQFDPFMFESVLADNPDFARSKSSNEEWKINVRFREKAKEEINKFEGLARCIREAEESANEVKLSNNISSNVEMDKIRERFVEQKKMLRVLLGEGRDGPEGKENSSN